MLMVIAVFGIMICLGSVVGFIAPVILMRLVRAVVKHPAGLWVAVLMRLVLGVVLILASPASRFPLAFLVLGVLAIAAAAALPLIGRQRMVRFVKWFAGMPAALMRLWLVFGFAFGVFLIYGVLD